MTVQELIDQLQQIEDKTVEVKYLTEDGYDLDLNTVDMYEGEDDEEDEEENVSPYVRIW